MINVEFHQFVHVIAQLVVAQAERGMASVVSIKAAGLRQFIKMVPLNFMRVKVEEDPQGFLDQIEKIFWVMRATNVERVNFVSYQLKEIIYL